MLASSLLALAAAQVDAAALQRVLQAWRQTPGAAAVSTQVVVNEGGREGVASVEPCVIAWDAPRRAVALRQGALTVVLEDDRLRAAHQTGDAAVDRVVGADRLAAWDASFAEMPWPQPGLALAPAADALRAFDPDMGPLEVTSVASSDEGGVQAQLQGPHGTWTLRFRGEGAPRLVEAERTITSGPRVPANGRIMWRMRFEPVDLERGVWQAPVEGRRRVDRVEDIMPSKAKKTRAADAAPNTDAPAEGATPTTGGASIPPTP